LSIDCHGDQNLGGVRQSRPYIVAPRIATSWRIRSSRSSPDELPSTARPHTRSEETEDTQFQHPSSTLYSAIAFRDGQASPAPQHLPIQNDVDSVALNQIFSVNHQLQQGGAYNCYCLESTEPETRIDWKGHVSGHQWSSCAAFPRNAVTLG